MPLVNQVYSGRLLNATDLLPLGRKRVAIIHEATVESVGQGKDIKDMIILSLTSAQGQPWPKNLPLKVTNARILAASWGQDTDAWIGKSIEVWAENTMYAGKVVPGISVAAVASPNGGMALPAPDPNANANVTATIHGPAPTQSGATWAGPGSDLDDQIPF